MKWTFLSQSKSEKLNNCSQRFLIQNQIEYFQRLTLNFKSLKNENREYLQRLQSKNNKVIRTLQLKISITRRSSKVLIKCLLTLLILYSWNFSWSIKLMMTMNEESDVSLFEGIDQKELHFTSFKQDKEFELVLYQGLKSHEFLSSLFMWGIIVLQNQINNQNNPQNSFSIQLH